MTTAAELVAAVQAAGGEVQAVGEVLRLRAPRPLPDALVETIRQHKADLLALLSSAPPWVPCPACGGCLFWADAREPPDDARWRCLHCAPPPLGLLIHACSLPAQPPPSRPAAV